MTGLNIALWKLNIIECRVVGHMTGSQHVGGPFCAERVPKKPLSRCASLGSIACLITTALFLNISLR